MERRSWLWRRKSSESESSGSVSDEQAYQTHTYQSPQVSDTDSVKSLTDKLSAALLNINAKQESVNQHSKLAQEAVSGWETAENEVLSLKNQLDSATQKSLTLRDRVGHLEGALKECVRQLRQAREDHELNVHEIVAKKTRECELIKSEFEAQLVELRSQLQSTNAKATASIDLHLLKKLEAVEKENAGLRLELFSHAEELEFSIIERDLSTQAAETASKHHLESMKKVSKLEVECRKLKAMVLKGFPTIDNMSLSASSIYIESLTDTQSNSGDSTDLNRCANEKSSSRNFMVPAADTDMMDDFLEMERLAALPDTRRGRSEVIIDPADSEEMSTLKAALESLIQRTAELEEKIEKMEAEKAEMKMVLTEFQKQLGLSNGQVKETEMKLVELQTMLTLANESKQAAEEEGRLNNIRREAADSRLKSVEAEMEKLLSKFGLLKENIKNDRAMSEKNVVKCRKLEDQIFRMRQEAELHQAVSFDGELKMKQDTELAVAASKFAECQRTIASLGQQLKSLATLDDFLIDKDITVEFNGARSNLSTVHQCEVHT